MSNNHGEVRRHHRTGRSLAFCAIASLVAVGCGGGSALAARCGDVVTEDLDPTWTVHLLPGAATPQYMSDPPTSGPHFAAEPVTGTRHETLDDPLQMTVLEVGGVLLQYRPDDVTGTDLARLERLSNDAVVVAPDPTLPDAVVATAWVTKQSCEGIDIDSLATFIEEHGGSGPGIAG